MVVKLEAADELTCMTEFVFFKSSMSLQTITNKVIVCIFSFHCIFLWLGFLWDPTGTTRRRVLFHASVLNNTQWDHVTPLPVCGNGNYWSCLAIWKHWRSCKENYGVGFFFSSSYSFVHLQCATQRAGSVCTVKELTLCYLRDSTPVTRNWWTSPQITSMWVNTSLR